MEPRLATRFNGDAWYRRISLVDITFWRPENEPCYVALSLSLSLRQKSVRTRSRPVVSCMYALYNRSSVCIKGDRKRERERERERFGTYVCNARACARHRCAGKRGGEPVQPPTFTSKPTLPRGDRHTIKGKQLNALSAMVCGRANGVRQGRYNQYTV